MRPFRGMKGSFCGVKGPLKNEWDSPSSRAPSLRKSCVPAWYMQLTLSTEMRIEDYWLLFFFRKPLLTISNSYHFVLSFLLSVIVCLFWGMRSENKVVNAVDVNPPPPGGGGGGVGSDPPPLGFSGITSSFITVSTWNLAHLSGHLFGVVSCK